MPEAKLAAVPSWAQQLGVAHVGEYFGAWAIMPEALRGALTRAQQVNLQVHVAESREMGDLRVAGGSRDYAVASGGVAVIDLRGPLMKQASSFSGGTSTVQARRQIRSAAADDEISAIVLRIDSPGGTVSGAVDLGDEIARAAKQKPLVAYIEDLGASGAYWAASQARKIYTGRAGIVGSIGTYGVLYDASGQAAMEGLKVHVVRAGDFKGAGVPGTEITAEILAEDQKLVDSLNEHFIRAVASGRKFTLERTRELADGRVHVGEEALAVGLVDGIQSFDETLSQLQSKSRSAKRMSAEQTAADVRVESAAELKVAAGPATIHELQAALPGADADFICRQMSANATLAQATSAWLQEQNARLAAANEKAAEAEKRAADAERKAARPGTAPLGARRAPNDDDEDEDDREEEAKSEWDRLVSAELKRLGGDPDKPGRGGRTNRMKAVANVAKKHPEAHRDFVASHNRNFAERVPFVFQQ